MEVKRMCIGRPGQQLVAPDGKRWVLRETAASSDGMRLEMDWFVPPSERLAAAAHLHPDGPEHWEIVAGTAGYRVGGVEFVEAAPHAFTVPGNTIHTHPWNEGEDELQARQIIALDEPMPGLLEGVQGYFETIFAFAQEGRVDANGDIDGRVQNLLTVHDLLMPGTFLAGPPRLAQRILLGSVSALARAAGMSAYREPRFDGAMGQTVAA